MNTVLNEQGLLKALLDGKTDKYESEDMDNAEGVAIAQNLHTKSILADEVRRIDYLDFHHHVTRLDWVEGFNEALQAVLKVIEAKE